MSLSTQSIVDQQVGNLERRSVAVPGWPDEVTILELDGRLLEQWEAYSYDHWETSRKNPEAANKAGHSIRSVLIGMSLCEQDGSRPFNTKAGYIKLTQLGNGALNHLYDECQKLNQLGKYLEETVGNSGDGQSNGSSQNLLEAVRSIEIPS
jgi:hypothetical protein